MTSHEAATVIRAISESLTTQPGQFKIEVSIIGQKVTSHSGVGLSITATGGAAGSKTIGQNVSVSTGNIEIKQGTQAFHTQLQSLIETLNKIANELETQSPNKGQLKDLYQSLLGTWVPGVITSVIGNVLGSAIGL